MARLHNGGSTGPVPGPAPGWLDGPPLVLPVLPVLGTRPAALTPSPCSVVGHGVPVHTVNTKVSSALAQAPPTGIRERWDALGGDGKENFGFGLAFLLVAVAALGYAHRINRSLRRLEGVVSARGSSVRSGRYLGSAVRDDLGDIAPRFSLRRLPFLARYTKHRTL
jgi:hypothetical protein